MSQNWPGQPQQPPQPGQPYPGYPQGQYPQQYGAPYSPYQMPQVHPMAYAQAQMQGLGSKFSRAGVMLMVSGALVGLCGFGCGALAMGPLEQMMADAPMDPQIAALMTPHLLKVLLIVLAVASLIYAVLAIAFGVGVRRQSKGATIAGVVLTSLVLVCLALDMLSGLVQVGRMGAQGLVGVCILIVPLVVGVWQLIWLFGALRASGQLRAMQNQMQMQYWQMMAMQQQQQQQYQQMMGQQPAAAPPPGQNPEVRSQNSEEKTSGGQG